MNDNKKAGRERLDALVFGRGLVDSREKARAVILAGRVMVNGSPADKPGVQTRTDAVIDVKRPPRYVSRGGEKLERALDVFGFDPAGSRMIDVGASTGGFTDCLLQRGAASVFAVDVGYGQLASTIRADARVVVAERTNIRDLTPVDVPDPFDAAVIDVSFISLRLVLPIVRALLAPAGRIIALVKPQFEAGKGKVGKGGVVRQRETHIEVLRGIVEFCADAKFAVGGLTWSPIRGPKGNVEFFVMLGALAVFPGVRSPDAARIAEVVDEARAGTTG